MAIPVGKQAETFKGVIALSDAAFFLLQKLNEHQTKESLLSILLDEFDVEPSVAKQDLESLLPKLVELELVKE